MILAHLDVRLEEASGRAAEPLPEPGLISGQVDRLKPEAVAGADREEAFLQVDDPQRGAADQVPAAGGFGRLDTSWYTRDNFYRCSS
jgi:hypothetical protein